MKLKLSIPFVIHKHVSAHKDVLQVYTKDRHIDSIMYSHYGRDVYISSKFPHNLDVDLKEFIHSVKPKDTNRSYVFYIFDSNASVEIDDKVYYFKDPNAALQFKLKFG